MLARERWRTYASGFDSRRAIATDIVSGGSLTTPVFINSLEQNSGKRRKMGFSVFRIPPLRERSNSRRCFRIGGQNYWSLLFPWKFTDISSVAYFCRGDDRSVPVQIVRNNEWRFYSLCEILEPWRMRQKGRAKLQFFHRASWRITVRRLATRLASEAHALRVFSNRHAMRALRAHTHKSMTSRLPFTDWLVVACRCNREDKLNGWASSSRVSFLLFLRASRPFSFWIVSLF